eukprot:CAMPEP_0181238942 /NCGR_PEP_ID=MMETSP1096-20121128/39643_1 /TAXON_ID=156174 ORGANISM="Chrysochromulina ericina, Strain CCMP281" /NCGR_SAMPLE_ID=MMETSP1096 /ASSEMBLY_ACC=CAM_ASM_000453 /LENGTH=146 /DNA_ID=CAMNT_0023334553 /DNA_START=184 /DNA_END=621 /DNA_ORIENTATION=+
MPATLAPLLHVLGHHAPGVLTRRLILLLGARCVLHANGELTPSATMHHTPALAILRPARGGNQLSRSRGREGAVLQGFMLSAALPGCGDHSQFCCDSSASRAILSSFALCAAAGSVASWMTFSSAATVRCFSINTALADVSSCCAS